MVLKRVQLPKQYKYIEGKTPKEFKKYHGRQKISYSQFTSWNSVYKGQYIANYFMGIKEPSGIFADFGTACGTYIETRDNKKISEEEKSYIEKLSSKDKAIMEMIDYPKGAIYEKEIVIDLKPFGINAVLQGFQDINKELKEGVVVIDFKTGAAKKEEFYSSDKYQQTTIYSYFEDISGKKIKYSGVVLFPRKGNGSEKHPLRLEGDPIYIKTPYSREVAEGVLAEVVDTCLEISDYYKLYKKYFKNA